MNRFPDNLNVALYGRFYAFMSMLPYMVLVALFFFAACFVLVWTLIGDLGESFQIVIVPFLLAGGLLTPFVLVVLYMLRWHGRRRLELDQTGVTMVLPNKRAIFVPWEFLVAVELRFSKPRLVQVTLISAAMRFSFSTLEINLDGWTPLNEIFKQGFALDQVREFLYYLHHKAPQLSWRLTQGFKDQFNIHHPPYDLEKLKYDDLGTDR